MSVLEVANYMGNKLHLLMRLIMQGQYLIGMASVTSRSSSKGTICLMTTC